MGMPFTVTRLEEVQVQYLRADCGVRYWEDATVDGVEDTDGKLIPCRVGDAWVVVIDVDTGVIFGWPHGVTASLHYKVCDAGAYALLDRDRNIITEIGGYVPKMLCPKDDCWGDYVIMDIDGGGKIDGWLPDLEYFST